MFAHFNSSPLPGTVGRVVFDEEFKSNPTGTAFNFWEKSGREIAPNGSLMRTAPVGVIFMNESEDDTFREAIRMGAVTHADPRCAVSVSAVSGLVRALAREEIKSEADINSVLERAWKFVSQSNPELPLDREEFHKHAYAESLEKLILCDHTMGYVYKCLGSSLWCLRQVVTERETFKTAMTKLIMFGGDADTNGAVAGALMGAYCGYNLLPYEWKAGLRYEVWYKGKISALCVVAKLTEGTYDSSMDSDTEFDGGRGFLSQEEMKEKEKEIMEKVLLADQRRRDARSAVKAKGQTVNKSRWNLW
jgi:hypothetical protein